MTYEPGTLFFVSHQSMFLFPCKQETINRKQYDLPKVSTPSFRLFPLRVIYPEPNMHSGVVIFIAKNIVDRMILTLNMCSPAVPLATLPVALRRHLCMYVSIPCMYLHVYACANIFRFRSSNLPSAGTHLLTPSRRQPLVNTETSHVLGTYHTKCSLKQ